MKTYFVLLLFLLFTISLFAQDDQTPERRIRFGVSTFAQINNYRSSDDDIYQTGSARGIGFSGELTFVINPKLSLVTGLGFRNYRGTIEERVFNPYCSPTIIGGGLDPFSGSIRFPESVPYIFSESELIESFISIPLSIHYSFSDRDNHFFVSAGMVASFRVGQWNTGRTHTCLMQGNIPGQFPLLLDFQDMDTHNIISFNSGIGYNMKVFRNIHLYILPYLDFGFTNVFETNLQLEQDNKSHIRMINYGLNVGIKL